MSSNKCNSGESKPVLGIARRCQRYRGNALIEYGLIVASLSLVVVAAAESLGVSVAGFFSRIAAVIAGV
jgi:Flp pilus assembly pilin Flp